MENFGIHSTSNEPKLDNIIQAYKSPPGTNLFEKRLLKRVESIPVKV